MKHPKVGWRYSNQKMTNQRDINTKTTKIKHREIVIYTTETDLIIEAINSIVKKIKAPILNQIFMGSW